MKLSTSITTVRYLYAAARPDPRKINRMSLIWPSQDGFTCAHLRRGVDGRGHSTSKPRGNSFRLSHVAKVVLEVELPAADLHLKFTGDGSFS